MEKAAFRLSDYSFPKTYIDYSQHNSSEIDISFKLKGEYQNSKSVFFLEFVTYARTEESENNFISIECKGVFEFQNVNSFEDIPEFFYVNCIAILFPYVRAYISTITIQTNITPIILPTLNLTSLSQSLIESTIEID